MARVLIVDDYEPWRCLIRTRLVDHNEWEIVGEAEDGPEAVEKARELRPDLILLDIGLPGMNGIEVAKQIFHTCPTSKIVFVTQVDDREVTAAALAAGAQAYLLKENVARELVATVQAVLLDGSPVFHPLDGFGRCAS